MATMGAAAAWVDGKQVYEAPAQKAALNDTAERIVAGIADETERDVVRETVLQAEAILTNAAWKANGTNSLSADANRRLMNAVGAQWTR